MKNQPRILASLLGAGVTLGLASSASADLKLSVEVGYGFGGTSSSGAYSGSPDTGYVVVKNTGTTTFTGELSINAPGLGGSFFDTSGPSYALVPGASWILLPGPESSNYGGYYKHQNGVDPQGPADDGALLSVIGTDGVCSINFSIHDKDIHSGVPATNPFGVVLDNYILQGGDPFGRDTGDGFEVAQAHAFFDLTCPHTPDAGSTAALLLLSLGGLRLVSRRASR